MERGRGMNLRRAEHWESTCDDCANQEGRHYCLLHTIQIKNMDIMRCEDYNNQILCADCGTEIGYDNGPPDGWQLEDGKTICHNCCIKDTKKQLGIIIH